MDREQLRRLATEHGRGCSGAILHGAGGSARPSRLWVAVARAAGPSAAGPNEYCMIAIAGLCAAAAFVVYVLFGYPALLALLARLWARPVRRDACEPTVSILLAVHNGERFLEQKLQSILGLKYPREKMHVVVASDGSTDATEEIAGRFAAQGVRLLQLERQGKAAALNAAMREATGEILVFTDVRQVLEPESLRRLMENFADPKVGAASAELVVLEGVGRGEADAGLYWRYEFWIRLH